MKDSITKMQNLIHILIFVLVFLLLFLFASNNYSSYTQFGYNYNAVIEKTREIEAEPENSIKVFFLGDSLTQAAISPEIIENTAQISSYNASTGGQWVGDSYAILQNTFKTQSPDAIVVESNYLYRDISKFESWLMNHAPLISHHLVPIVLSEETVHVDPLKGYSTTNVVVPYEFDGSYMENGLEKHDFPLSNHDYLDTIYELCSENNAVLIVITLPTAKTMIDGKWTSWTIGKHLAVEEWCSSHNITYIDYNYLLADIDFDWSTDYRDGGDHVNNSGAYKISNDLARRLSDLIHLENRKDGE